MLFADGGWKYLSTQLWTHGLRRPAGGHRRQDLVVVQAALLTMSAPLLPPRLQRPAAGERLTRVTGRVPTTRRKRPRAVSFGSANRRTAPRGGWLRSSTRRLPPGCPRGGQRQRLIEPHLTVAEFRPGRALRNRSAARQRMPPSDTLIPVLVVEGRRFVIFGVGVLDPRSARSTPATGACSYYRIVTTATATIAMRGPGGSPGSP